MVTLKNIEKYEKLDNKCLVTFKSGRKITLDVNYQTFENQVLRAARLENIIHNRKNRAKKTIKYQKVVFFIAFLCYNIFINTGVLVGELVLYRGVFRCILGNSQ